MLFYRLITTKGTYNVTSEVMTSLLEKYDVDSPYGLEILPSVIDVEEFWLQTDSDSILL